MASLDSISQGIETFLNKPAVQSLISTGTVASEVYAITDNPSDAGLAGGYSAWVESITGNPPSVKRLEGNRAQVNLSPMQVKQMQGWLDSQVSSILTPAKEKPSLDINFGPVVKPWSIKYGAPALVIVFILGWLTRWGMYR